MAGRSEHWSMMGKNERYGSDLTDAAMNEALVRPAPISLSRWELGIPEGEAIPEVPEPVDVVAWVRFPEFPIQVPAKAVAWTDRAVWVEFTMRGGAIKRAWVWASAVSRPTRESPRPNL